MERPRPPPPGPSGPRPPGAHGSTRGGPAAGARLRQHRRRPGGDLRTATLPPPPDSDSAGPPAAPCPAAALRRPPRRRTLPRAASVEATPALSASQRNPAGSSYGIDGETEAPGRGLGWWGETTTTQEVRAGRMSKLGEAGLVRPSASASAGTRCVFLLQQLRPV